MKSLKLLFTTVCVFAISGWSVSQAQFPCGQDGEKVKMCHNNQTICVAKSAVQAHLNHGDSFGPCADDCIDPNLINFEIGCIAVYDPVCGCDNVTYSNGCVATFQFGVTSFTKGECGCIDPSRIDPDKICALIFNPVCGCDGVTYSNPCFADGAGVTSFTPGPCGGVIIGKKSLTDEQGTQSIGPEQSVTTLEVYPNPFSQATVITFGVARSGNATLEVFDVAGALVATLFNGYAEANTSYRADFNAVELSGGIYIAKFTDSNGDVFHNKLLLTK